MANQSTDPEDDQQIRPFAAYLAETNKGRTHADLSQGLHDLIAQVTQLGKKGTLQLTITVEPEKNSDSILKVSEQVIVKAPKPAARTSIFYVDGDGNFTRRDPEQMEFGDIKPVPAVAGTPVKEAK